MNAVAEIEGHELRDMEWSVGEFEGVRIMIATLLWRSFHENIQKSQQEQTWNQSDVKQRLQRSSMAGTNNSMNH